MKSKFEQCKSCAIKCPSNIRMAKLNKGRIPFDKCMDYDPIRTNADRIRNMTNEGLAEFLTKQFCHGVGENLIKEWLESECDVEC